MDTPGTNRAAIIGTLGRIEIDAIWYTSTTFTVFDSAGEPLEHFVSEVPGRGMLFQAWELERLVAEGARATDLLPPQQSVLVMHTLDEVRRQIGLAYPSEVH